MWKPPQRALTLDYLSIDLSTIIIPLQAILSFLK